MNKQIIYILLFSILFTPHFLSAQETVDSLENRITKLFKNQKILPLKFTYSIIELNKITDDSTFIKSTISFEEDDNAWKDINVEMAPRGNFRRAKCYFTPVKLKIKKSDSKGSLFKDQKNLKLVLPCLNSDDKNDYVIKEFIAYKLYEVISKYHFKTRLAEISFSELRRNSTKIHQLKGILIEDDKNVAKRHEGEVLDRDMHPLNQDNETSVRNAFFQFMIGNVDFSIAKRHNAKLMYINKTIIPVPYDFDMCGLVNPSYEVITQDPNNKFNLKSLKERKFRGLKRDLAIYEKVRQEFLNNKIKLLTIIDSFESDFENKAAFTNAKEYINSFFSILSNEASYKNEILDEMR